MTAMKPAKTITAKGANHDGMRRDDCRLVTVDTTTRPSTTAHSRSDRRDPPVDATAAVPAKEPKASGQAASTQRRTGTSSAPQARASSSHRLWPATRPAAQRQSAARGIGRRRSRLTATNRATMKRTVAPAG